MGLKRPTAGAGEAAAQTITLSMSAMWDTVRAAMREAEAAALEPTQR
nr:unknown [Zea mays]